MVVKPNESDFYEKSIYGGVTVLLHWCRESNGYEWEIYYKKPDYPYMYAFGLPACDPVSAFELAVRNADEYNYLFEEEQE